MKKTIKFSLLAALFAVTAFVGPLKAQDAKKELLALVKQFEAAYNKKDDKALKEFYTTNATRIAADGTSLTGNDKISAEFAKFFADSPLTIEIKQEKSTIQADGSAITSGTYHVTGTSATGEKIDNGGTFTNTLVKEKGKWKISKSVLGTL